MKSTKCNDATSVQGETSVHDEISTQCNPLYINKTNVVNNKTDRCLKILGLNVCGLQCRLDQCIIQDYVKDLGILCFSETKLDKIDEDNIHIANFTCMFHHRKKFIKRCGGLVIFVKSKIIDYITELKYSEAECVQWIKISKK